ncbi:VOC family protein [Microbacterium sp. cx-59]|uniref:VOC family protein n=1 Tax=Microbacterium sp. cx-59 TaxID=2891207 RepID=UPI001E583309|nr:VOC family protein [Microbacterium sp. cx-59]MCC4908727.1 VOC family protein [Microbacterium sp. cx-59]
MTTGVRTASSTPHPASDAHLLHAATEMGAVTLRVADLDRMRTYFAAGVGLDVLSDSGAVVTLGRGGMPIVVLEHSPLLRLASPADAGLYHTAIVFDSERDLARALLSVAQKFPGSFTGSADHIVSKAFYFDDPEGNGVELYWDRPRSTYRWVDGTLQMGTLPLDPNRYLAEHLGTDPDAEAPASGAKVGHIHLQVGDVDTAREFYVTRLGFDSVIEMPGSALFVSAGGYHHHMAMNVWRSRGAGPRVPSLGLGSVRIEVPGADDLTAVRERLTHYGHAVRDDGQSIRVSDPWNNEIEIAAAARRAGEDGAA